MGGGVKPVDGLFKFKASFSPKRLDFCTGTVIYNDELYVDLCRRTRDTSGGQLIDEEYFPLYRAPEKLDLNKSPGANSFLPPKIITEKSEPLNILFINVGRRVSLIKAFREAMFELEISGRIFGVDANLLSPAFYVTDLSFQICHISDDEYIPSLLEICTREKITVLISLLDTDLLKLSESREVFRDNGTFVLISSPEVVRIGRDKYLTRQFFLENGISTPRVLTYEEALRENRFPLFIKPLDGSASLFTFRVDNQEVLNFLFTHVPRPIIQEFVLGQEYTLDLFIDMDHNLRAVVPRKRLEIRAGEVSKSQIVLDPKIMTAGRRMGEALAAKGGLGPINVQCIMTEEGEVQFIEINPRFGGGSPLSLKAGYPFPQWIMEMILGRELSPLPADLGNGLTMLRFDDAVFIQQ